MQHSVSYFLGVLLLLGLAGCYPDTLRQQMAGCDTVEIIFYPKNAQEKADTLVIAQKKYIKELLSDFSAERYSVLACPPHAKIIFKKARQKYTLLEGELGLDGHCAYIVYAEKGKKVYRKLAIDRIHFLELARRHSFFFERML